MKTIKTHMNINEAKERLLEALEAAAEPGDLSEWADMQFLLWDAQRRAGISDGEISSRAQNYRNQPIRNISR